MTQQQPKQINLRFCDERERLRTEFVAASHQLIELQFQQTQAVIDGDPEFARFDDLLHMARAEKDHAKYALIAHIEEHFC